MTISLHVFFSDRNGSKKETSVIISNAQLAENIGCSETTSDRVMKSLKDIDCYLLIAPSNGVNVWCGACGDDFLTDSTVVIIPPPFLATSS